MAEDVNVEYYYGILLLSAPQHAGIYVELFELHHSMTIALALTPLG